jgi:Family of unknown function (DUF6159)
MFIRIQRSWKIFNNSLNVLANNKKLVLFPILSTIFLIVIVMLIFGGVASFFLMNPEAGEQLTQSVQSTRESSGGQEDNAFNILHIIILFAAYFVSIFMATFFNVAFYSEIIHGLRGSPVFIKRGFSFAFSKLGSIAMWALLGATVGTALKLLEERLGWLGQLVIRLIGLVWAVATIFAVPVIICNADSLNPITNLKKSAGIIKRTWGESLIGFLGMSMLSFLLDLPIILITIVLAVLSLHIGSTVLAISVVCLGIIAMIIIGMLVKLTEHIYIASLYLYATEGCLNEAYDEEVMAQPFKTKK